MQDNQIINIEAQILSTILHFGKDIFESVYDFLRASDFSLHLHSCIFKACERLLNENSTIDENTVCLEMQKDMKINLDDIMPIISLSPLSNLETYIKMIKENAIKRELKNLAGFIHKESTSPQNSSDMILDSIESKIFALSMHKDTEGFVKGKEAVIKAIEHIKRVKELQNILIGTDTGFKELNEITTGFNKGELIVIGARPSMGKTALILSMILKTLASGRGVALFNLEMSITELMLRMLSAHSRIPMQDIRKGRLDDREMSKLSQASQYLCSKDSFYIDDGHNLTLSNLRSKLRRLKSQDSNISIAFIDYLQLMQPDKSKNLPRHEEIAEISRGLKKLARELEIPIVTLAQLNRSLEYRDDKRPILSDLKESGSIEQDADIIMFLYRDEVYKEREHKHRAASARKQGAQGTGGDKQGGTQIAPYIIPQVEDVELIVAKNRNGEIRTIKVKFEKQYTAFIDIEEHESYNSLEETQNIDIPF